MAKSERRHASPRLTGAAFQILLALADGEKHGYAIMQEVASQTDGAVRLGAGTLYRTIKHLLATGWIEQCPTQPEASAAHARRRYYRLCDDGRQVAAGEARRMEAAVRAVHTKRLLTTPEGRS